MTRNRVTRNRVTRKRAGRPGVALAALTIALAAMLAPVASDAAAGRVLFATRGVTSVDEGGRERALRRGSRVDTGDTIRTTGGRAQIRFSDGAMTSLMPDTEFRIDEYAFEKEETEKSRSFFSLVKGGLRTITGAIGKLRRRSYRLSTPVATIGIRGTEYTAVLGNSLDVNTGLGTITVQNSAGTLLISDGESAHIAGAGSFPLLTPDKPVLPPPQSGNKDPNDDSDGSGSSDYQLGSDQRTLLGILSGALTSGPRYVMTVAFGDEETPEDIPAGAGLYTRGRIWVNDDDREVYQDESRVFGLFDQYGRLRGFISDETDDESAVAGVAGTAAFGLAAGVDAGIIGWGRWTDGRIQVQGEEYDGGGINGDDGPIFTLAARNGAPPGPVFADLDQNQGHHYVIGVPTSYSDLIRMQGDVRYDPIGGTRPTISDGSTEPGWLLPGTHMTAHFGDQKISADIRFVFDENFYHIDTGLSAGDALRMDDDLSRFSGSAPVSGGDADGAYVEGFFAGRGAAAMGVGYKVELEEGPYITGTAAFGRGGPGPPLMSDDDDDD